MRIIIHHIFSCFQELWNALVPYLRHFLTLNLFPKRRAERPTESLWPFVWLKMTRPFLLLLLQVWNPDWQSAAKWAVSAIKGSLSDFRVISAMIWNTKNRGVKNSFDFYFFCFSARIIYLTIILKVHLSSFFPTWSIVRKSGKRRRKKKATW